MTRPRSSHVEQLYEHAAITGTVEALFDIVADSTWGKLPTDDGRERWNRWADARARQLLSALNRKRLGLTAPPPDAMSALAEAVYYSGARRVPWKTVREWLMAVWGWSEQEAEEVMFDAVVRNRVPDRKRAVGLITRPEVSIPDLDWFLTLRPNRVRVVRA